MIKAYTPKGRIFKKVQIKSSNWTPKPNYYDKYFFVAIYEKVELPGIYFSFYVTKDWKCLVQLHFSNPGNMISAPVFSKDSVNILEKMG